MISLHIANDFAGSTVYKNLVKNLDFFGVEQIVYTAIRESSLVGKNSFVFQNKESYILYQPILNYNTDRIYFKGKVKKIVKDLISNVVIEKVDVIHAHTWFSDGAVAFELFKKYNKPYIITIRNTDMNLFYKFMLHLRTYGELILKNAKKIIFISDVYKERFIKLPIYLCNERDFIKKISVIYNGIDPFWIENFAKGKKGFNSDIFRILYIGKFDKGKNVPRLIEAVKKANSNFPCTLTLVGGGGKDSAIVSSKIKEYNFISFKGPIYDKAELKKIFNEHDLFAMPSEAETFGLVYIEALSQGIPILNTINEGIYGMYDNVGESVVCKSIANISEAIVKVRNSYECYEIMPKNIVEYHDWENIAVEYNDLYKEIVS